MEDLSDEELVARYRAEPDSRRKSAYLNHLFQRHHTRVGAWCYRMTGSVDSAADLAQEVFLKAFQRIEAFRGDSRFSTWLYAIARNHCMDELRSRAVRAEEPGDDLADFADTRNQDFSEAMEQRQSAELVRTLMRESLDETETRVMTLHYVHEMPLDSVTRLLGLENQSGAKAYIVSARRKLSRAFARWNSRQPARGVGNAE